MSGVAARRRQARALSGARAAADDARRALALPTLADTVPPGEHWLHEVKRDGYRMTVVVRDGAVRCWSRQDLDWTARLPAIVAAIGRLGVRDAQLDGEVIAVADGRDDFNLLQRSLDGETDGRLAYVAFDVLRLERVDVTRAPLLERKALLQQLVEGYDVVYSSHVVGNGKAVFDAVAAEALEGIVSKRAESAYPSGRTREWRKIMARLHDDFVVVGTMAPTAKSHGGLMVARRVGAALEYAGRVAAGIRAADEKMLRERLREARAPRVRITPHLDVRRGRITWFEPTVTVRVAFRGVGRDGLLRHPSFKGVRRDA